MSAAVDCIRRQLADDAKDDEARAAATIMAGLDLLLAEALLTRVPFHTLAKYRDDAMRAKTKIKARKNGWSQVSKDELIALAFFAELMFDDFDIEKPAVKPTEPEAL